MRSSATDDLPLTTLPSCVQPKHSDRLVSVVLQPSAFKESIKSVFAANRRCFGRDHSWHLKSGICLPGTHAIVYSNNKYFGLLNLPFCLRYLVLTVLQHATDQHCRGMQQRQLAFADEHHCKTFVDRMAGSLTDMRAYFEAPAVDPRDRKSLVHLFLMARPPQTRR